MTASRIQLHTRNLAHVGVVNAPRHTANRLTEVFKNVIETVRELPTQVVLSKGGGKLVIDGQLPEKVMAVDLAPQLRLVERGKNKKVCYL